NYIYVHLHPMETDRAKDIRQEQLDEILAIINGNKNEKGWIVLGDVNIERESEGHTKMIAKGFRDVIGEEHGKVETCINGLEKGEKNRPESIDYFLTYGKVNLK